jgi:hypothetical protein
LQLCDATLFKTRARRAETVAWLTQVAATANLLLSVGRRLGDVQPCR